jgi:hypothetical protein
VNISSRAIFRLSLGKGEGRVRVRIANRLDRRRLTLILSPLRNISVQRCRASLICHSERSEESLIISLTARQGKSQRCFASLNMTGERDMPERAPNEGADHR